MSVACEQLVPVIGRRKAHEITSTTRANYYRNRKPKPGRISRPHKRPKRALSDDERMHILEIMGGDRFVDTAPGAVVATLLDEGQYLASERTIYRVLAAATGGVVRERRRQLTHPPYARPELIATGPNQVYTWDITKLRGAGKHNWFHLYTIIDIFSRKAVGWMVADRESEYLAERLIADTIYQHNITPGQLTVHADRGPSMRSRTVAQMLADLGVEKTHNRPYTSSDNPFSEAHFKTMKYRFNYPNRFATLADAQQWCTQFFDWYNNHHRHSGINMLTPNDVHNGHAPKRIKTRQTVLDSAYKKHPERFNQPPRLKSLPTEVYINPPLTK